LARDCNCSPRQNHNECCRSNTGIGIVSSFCAWLSRRSLAVRVALGLGASHRDRSKQQSRPTDCQCRRQSWTHGTVLLQLRWLETMVHVKLKRSSWRSELCYSGKCSVGFRYRLQMDESWQTFSLVTKEPYFPFRIFLHRGIFRSATWQRRHAVISLWHLRTRK
jgi:hypothetical protein